MTSMSDDASSSNTNSRAASMSATASRAKVSSACDSCKRRKIKCDGKQPCVKCTSAGVASLLWIDRLQTSGLSNGRTTAVSYTRHLEEKVAELQTLLRQQQLSHVDDRPERSPEPDRLVDTLTGSEDDYVFQSDSGPTSFHGRFAGLSVLRTVRDLCSVAAGTPDPDDGFSGRSMSEAFDCNMLDMPVYDQLASFAVLPTLERVYETISIALDCALNCRECVDRQKLYQGIDDLYARNVEDFSPSDKQFLGLVYSLMAMGRRHESDDGTGSPDAGAQMIMLKGLTYFRAARSILDTTNAHDLNSIRSLIVMASYLMSASMISKAYTCLCAAVSASLRMGLHVASPVGRDTFSAEELTERRQVFAVLNILDTFVSSTLGMPNILRDADKAQVIPAPEDEMHDLGRSFVLRNPDSPIAETILCAKLFQVQAQIVQDHFPTSRYYSVDARGKHEMDHSRIEALELQLQQWHRELPEMLPQDPIDHRVLRSQLLLRFAHTSVQISLYRPFLHHVTRNKHDPDFSYKGYALASACIQASMQAIWLIDSMDQHGYLHEAQWFTIYNLALAASCLNLFVLATKQGPTVDESRAAALKAQELLGRLSVKNVSARRCYESLKALTDSQEGEEGALSPRTRFMIGIGVTEPEF